MAEERRDKNGLTEAEFLAAYHPGDWPHPSVTADTILLANEPDGCRVLLVRRGNHPSLGMWALPGGFVEPEEPPRLAAKRELLEETCLQDIPAVLLGVFGDAGRDPRGWTITCCYAALVDRAAVKPHAADDAADTRWFTLSLVPEGDNLRLTLTDGSETLWALLQPERTVSPLGTDVNFTILKGDGIAFDHAKLLATAALRLQNMEKHQ